MKFKDKLPKLRKNNNITQEQLADMMGVSRQAVSKWESGLSIPDMEKIIELCKIFNCQIDELLDDGISSSSKLQKQKSFKEIVDASLGFITKTYKMFCSMKFLEKIKCLFELGLIIGIQFLLYLIIGIIFKNLTANIFSFLPWSIYDFIRDIFEFIYVLLTLIIGSVITIHLFKVRYLNYFVIVSDKIERTTKEEKEILDTPKETIIIRDVKTNSSSLLIKIGIAFLKTFSFIIAVPLIITFLILSFLTICSLFYIKNGLIFIGIFLTLLGILVINYIALEFLYSYIFNLKINYKKIFIILVTSLLAIGIGSATVFTNYLTFRRIENNLTYKELNTTIPLDKTKTLHLYDIKKENIIIDNSVEDIELTVEYIGNIPEVETYDNSYCDESFCYKNNSYYLHVYNQEDFAFYINLIIKDFKNKNLRNYDNIETNRIKEIRIAEKNLVYIKYNF